MTNPSFEVRTVDDLDKFLKGTLRGLKLKEVTIEEADAISKIADKIVKNNLTRLMYKKLTNNNDPLADFEPAMNRAMLQKID